MQKKRLKVALCTPDCVLGDLQHNKKVLCAEMEKAHQNGADVFVFPELSVCGYTSGALFGESFYLQACRRVVGALVTYSKGLQPLFLIGTPLLINKKTYNVAVVYQNGKVLGVAVKNGARSDFFESSYFALKDSLPFKKIRIFGQNCPVIDGVFATDFYGERWKIAVEFSGEAFDAPSKKNRHLTINLSAIPTKIRSDYALKKALAMRSKSGIYVLVNAGAYESTADAIFGGEKYVYVDGKAVEEQKAFSYENVAVSIEKPEKATFHNAKTAKIKPNTPLQTPFLPTLEEERNGFAEFVLEGVATALKARLTRARAKTAVIGVSGGLDSTIALLAIERTAEKLGWDKKQIIAVTMPGFGTTGATYENSLSLMRSVGATVKEIDVTKSVLQHFEDIGHDKNAFDTTYENAQARMRTLILMDLANKTGGIVIGTGDLSEIALGWSTYNGDHMSMYCVNSTLPKTLIRYLVGSFAEKSTGERRKALFDVYQRDISPELLPPSEKGEILQKTQDIVGPYELHDFFLYRWMCYGETPKQILHSATKAFLGKYDRQTVRSWLVVFFRRFTTQQFKRACAPDGASIGEVTLSARVWRMPADVSINAYLSQL